MDSEMGNSVLEEPDACISRVEKMICFTLMMEATGSSETLEPSTRLYGVTPETTATFKLITMRISNFTKQQKRRK
jgi:hypothetical protein